MILFILLPALAGQALIASIGYNRSGRAMLAQLEGDMALMVRMQADGLLNIYGGLVREMADLGESAPVRDLLAAHDAGDEAALKALRRRASEHLAEIAQAHPVISLIGIADASGVITVHSVPSSIGTSRANKGYFKRAMQGLSSTEDVQSETTGQFRTFLSLPMLGGADGKTPIGCMYAAIDNSKLAQISINAVSMGMEGVSFVYNGDGVLVMHPRAANIGRNDGDREHVRRMLSAPEGTMVEFEEGGKDRMAFSAFLPELNWTVVMEVSRDAVLEPVMGIRTMSIILFLVCGGIIGATIFLLTRNLSGILATAARIVEEASAGNFAMTPARETFFARAGRRRDEIGIVVRGLRELLGNTVRLLGESEQKAKEARKAELEAREASEKASKAARYAEQARQEGMHAAARQLSEVVDALSETSAGLAARMDEASRTAAEASEHLSGAATAMNEMNATVQEVARNASDASRVSGETRDHAMQGADIVRQAESGIQEVQRQTRRLKDDMEQLSGHAQSISQVMGVISDIADQTNLLALNAAIEAARAGEAGRGFAVVADEVRKLAEKTMSATAEVSRAVATIQEGTSRSMAGVDATVERMEQATEQARASGEALTRIVSDVDASADEVRAIAAASEEQSSASEEINRSITRVNGMAERSALAMREASDRVADMRRQVERLEALIGELRRS